MILLIKFVNWSLPSKQNLKFLKSSSIFFIWDCKQWKCRRHQKNLGFSQALSLRWSIRYFYIRLDALFITFIISNEIQQQARIWPLSTQSLQFKHTLLVTAAQTASRQSNISTAVLWSDALNCSQQCNESLLWRLCRLGAVSSIMETI